MVNLLYVLFLTFHLGVGNISQCPNQQLINESLERVHIPGAAIIVVNATDILYQHAYGYQSLLPKRSMDIDTSIFPLASISKTFIATAVMQLVEKELVDLDTDINRYLFESVQRIYHPDYPSHSITLRKLLSHTASIAVKPEEQNMQYKPGDTAFDETLSEFCFKYINPNTSNWLPKSPGSVAFYSNEGSSLAALVVERVANMSYSQYVKEKILKPLGVDISKVGVRLSDFENTEDFVKHYAYVFNTTDLERWQQVMPRLNFTPISDNLPTWLHISNYGFGAYPAGLLRMSANTLSVYLRMFLNNGSSILRPRSIAEIRTIVGGGTIPDYGLIGNNNSTQESPSSQFGLSWYWQTMSNGRRYLGHSGSILGMIHLMLVDETNSVGVILLSNGDINTIDFMANISNEVRNYFKLDLLISRACLTLRNLFITRYSLFNNGQIWIDSAAHGNNYLTNVISKNKKINLTPAQKKTVGDGDTNEWDVSTLTAILLHSDRPQTMNANEIQKLNQEDLRINKLRELRNKVAHKSSKSVDNTEFNQLWNDLSTILVALGDIDTELDKLKDDSVFESPKQTINEENKNEALRLNSLGTQAHKNEKYSEAIKFFTQAVVLPSVPNHDRATFFSNMAGSRLSLYKQQLYSVDNCEDGDITKELDRALKDAKQARKLWVTWWKAHFRVGQVYAILDDHDKAINSFERALALEPTKSEIQQALDESCILVNRSSRQEYLDPRENLKTIPENLNELKEKFGLDPEMVRKDRSLLKVIDPSMADVMKGHQFASGDIDVIQDYEQAAKYFAKAANAGNAEGMCNLALLFDKGLGVKKDHKVAREWFEKAAAQPEEHPRIKGMRNIGVAESEYALGVRYFEGISIRKDLSLAAYWYQCATDHGSAMAANSLGAMYLAGLGLDKNLEKGEELHELAAKRGDPVAMMTLAKLRLDKNDFEMARIWYDRACESDNPVAHRDRDNFIEDLEARQKYSPDMLKAMKTAANYMLSFQSKISPSVASELPYLKDYEMLCGYAKRGSITAKNLCRALEHYIQALNILLFCETLTEEQENIFVHELSQCYRIEQIVAQIPAHMHKKVSNIIERVLSRCKQESNFIVSQLDEDVRVCYATLNLNSYGIIEEFVELCKQKYPKSVYFFLTSGAVHGFRRQSDAGLYNINNGLEIEPDNYELLYHKAVLLRHIGRDMNEAIAAYQKFIKIAPKDHRKIPEAYYEMAQCLKDFAPNAGMRWIQDCYKEGKQAEKLQLPCFLPYKSDNIAFIQPFIDMMDSNFNVEPDPINNRKQHLTDSHRIEVIKNHRQWEKTTLDEKHNPFYKT
ncbi:unnamed protein product, partial [Adineta steineri]